jgi:hypothetical protein
MGRVGSALDNAVSESFNSVLKVEFVHRQSFATPRRGQAPYRDLDRRLLQHAPPPQRRQRLAPIEFERIMKERRNSRDHHAAVAA